MLVKTVDPAFYTRDEPVARLVKWASRGLRGQDLTDFMKEAGDSGPALLEQLKKAEIGPGEHPIHLIAMGADETWGANRNGDGFRKKALETYHPTFVKHARWYRDHVNKDPDLSYGRVKAGAYHPNMHRVELVVGLATNKEAAERLGTKIADKEMHKLASGKDLAVSMACGRFGTMVKLRDGWKKIEDVVPGDYVLTHTGQYQRVNATKPSKRSVVAELAVRGLGRQILEFTPDHEFYVARYANVPRPKMYCNGLVSKDSTGFSKNTRQKYRPKLHAYARWLPCGELRPGDLLLVPIPKSDETSALTPAMARVYGYYIAEGYIDQGYPRFVCHRDDAAVAELPKLLDGIKCTITPHAESDKAVNVFVASRSVGAELEQAIGRNVHAKRIPGSVWNATKSVKMEFISTWLNGDGWQDRAGLHWSTCSQTLATELQMLLASVGVASVVNKLTHTSDLPDRCREKPGIEYVVSARNRYSELFVGRSKATRIAKKQQTGLVFITGDYLALPVVSVEFKEGDFDVCDLSVPGDRSFTAYGVAVHNCTIPYDECDACGNKAKTRQDYCKAASCPGGGCEGNLTKLYKKGSDMRRLYVHNDHPRFFDISFITSDRPADQTAYGNTASWLQKSAEEKTASSSAEIAEMLEITPPPDVIVETLGADHPRVSAQVKVACGFDLLQDNPDLVEHYLRGAWPAIAPEQLKLAGDKAGALAALADCEIILPLAHYAHATGREHLAKAASAFLPGAYRRLVVDPQADQKFLANAVVTAVPSSLQKQAAFSLVAACALTKQAAMHRGYAHVLAQAPAPTLNTQVTTKIASDVFTAAGKLAEDYALYKVGAFVRMLQNGVATSPMLTSRLAACHDRLSQ